jgi:hypothetical protein
MRMPSSGSCTGPFWRHCSAASAVICARVCWVADLVPRDLKVRRINVPILLTVCAMLAIVSPGGVFRATVRNKVPTRISGNTRRT